MKEVGQCEEETLPERSVPWVSVSSMFEMSFLKGSVWILWKGDN